jgi:hypothetical protein
MSQTPDTGSQENASAPAPFITSKHYVGVALVAATFAFGGYLFAQSLTEREEQARPAPPVPQTSDPVRLTQAWNAPRPRAPVRAAQDDEASEGSFNVEAPEVVELGWGWSQARGEPVPTVCVVFEPVQRKAQSSDITIKEVRDSYSLSKAMNVSASVSVKAIGYEASGKASFAKNSSVSSTSVSFLVNAEVLNSAMFAAPPAAKGGRAVRLTEAAAAMAKRDIERFQETCGEGYVSSTVDGARAYLLATTETTSKTERESMKASVKGSGWGVKVEAAASGSSETGTENLTRTLTFIQQGGAADLDADDPASEIRTKLPKDAKAAIARIEDLAYAAAQAGKVFEISITPYQVLENFPRGADILPQEVEHDELVALWSSYTQLYADIVDVLETPEAYLMPLVNCVAETPCTRTLGAIDNTGIRLLEDMQDMALVALDRIESEAEKCLADEEDCRFDATLVRSPYAVRASMPIPAPATPADTGAQAESGTETAGADKGPTLDDHKAVHLREPSTGRCAFGALTLECISNAVIRGWAARAGLATRVVADRAGLKTKLAVCGEDPDAFILLGDPGEPDAPTIWFPANITLGTNGSVTC